MNLKVNDIIRIKSWDTMANQYGIVDGSIDIHTLFTPQMKKYCGGIYRIVDIMNKNSFYGAYDVYKIRDMGGLVRPDPFDCDFTKKMFDIPEAIEALPKDKKEFNEELI